ncbi:hypothetical protein IV203_020163 [Nitzschia inconspicua]|uniref:Uncharacterized protein n=1 Tax=Nitzschia inconspicua TaxID=303405 RepID=A0A9K3Q593_9STRA|nr:hypothetical protein IV203_020353 [Nitzschia inconspicua]KAG7371593.1 hypothetical protein IV203_020163 [Nitzschia inconspicua]
MKKHYGAPLKQSEKLHWSNVIPEAIEVLSAQGKGLRQEQRMSKWFTEIEVTSTIIVKNIFSIIASTANKATTNRTTLAADDLDEFVPATLKNEIFVETVRGKTPPIAILALATVVAYQVLNPLEYVTVLAELAEGDAALTMCFIPHALTYFVSTNVRNIEGLLKELREFGCVQVQSGRFAQPQKRRHECTIQKRCKHSDHCLLDRELVDSIGR